MYPSNVKFNSSHSADMKLTIYPKLWELVEQLALAYPTWEFVEYSSNGLYERDPTTNLESMTGIKVYDIKVVCNGEVLGNVAVQTWSNNKYVLRNRRISEALDRRTAMTTSDVKKAIKLFKKYFFGKTQIEVVKDTLETATSRLGNFASNKEYRVRTVLGGIREPAIAYLSENIASFYEFAKANHPSARFDLIDAIPEILSEADGATNIQEAYQSGDAVMVYIQGDDNNYILASKDAKDVKVTPREELPPKVIQRIGMLKLVDVDQAIAGVGYRASDTTFIVMTI